MAQDTRRRRLASVAAGGLVVAAALGTGAFALWSDSNLIDGAAIETGLVA